MMGISVLQSAYNARDKPYFGLISQLKLNRLVKKCEICIKNQPRQKYPMIQTSTPDGPWHKIATDFMEFHKINYLILIDYYSRYIDIAQIQTFSAIELIARCKKIFARMAFLTKFSQTWERSSPQQSGNNLQRTTASKFQIT